MRLLKILMAALTGTTAMTGFSYLASNAADKQFREPELLSALIKRLNLYKRNPKGAIDGWITHYVAGCLFAMVYDQLWRNQRIPAGVKNGFLLGTISGFFGAEVWRAVLKFHPNPPKVHFKDYYNQLIVAHMIFGVFAKLGYELPDRVIVGKILRARNAATPSGRLLHT